ncbi:hypothetical protein BH11CYA1_BH11CYA1_49190 [soil metagenome]
MNVFKYLNDDGDSIAHRLNETVANFGVWPQERLLEESKRAFASLEGHFEKEQMIVKNIDHSEVVIPMSERAEAEIKGMDEAIDSIVMIHIDEPGFRNALESLAVRFNDHRAFCVNEYYPKLQSVLSEADNEHVNAQFEQMVLS